MADNCVMLSKANIIQFRLLRDYNISEKYEVLCFIIHYNISFVCIKNLLFLEFYLLFSTIIFCLAKINQHPINPAPYLDDILSVLKILSTTILTILIPI